MNEMHAHFAHFKILIIINFTITSEGLQKLVLCSALREQGGFFIMPQLL
jgi:hypothetical protein